MAEECALAEEYDLYLDGRWVTPEAGRYDDVSPSTETVLATAPDASIGQVDAALAAARRAFDAGDWATSPELRARCLEQLGNALLGRLDDFFALSQQEWGCIANARLFQIDGPPFMMLRAAELAMVPVELPAHPQPHEAGRGAGRRQHRRAQTVTVDATGWAGACEAHRRAH